MNWVEGVQTDMFEGIGTQDTSRSDIAWSYSRREALSQCPRRYYYQYYGSAVRRAKGEPNKEILRFLKTLSNRHLRAGQVLHSSIHRFLAALRRGHQPEVKELLDRAKGVYGAGPVGASIHSQGDQRTGLLEYHYRFADADELFRQCEERLLHALTNFVTSSQFAPFIGAGARPEAHAEKRVVVRVGNVKGNGKIDLVYPAAGQVTIADWKLGNSGSTDDSLQLSFYALWGIQEYGCSSSGIRLYAAHLCDSVVASVPVSAKSLQRTKACIIQDVQKMEALDGYGNNAVLDAFPPCSHPRICVLCPFQGICLEDL